MPGWGWFLLGVGVAGVALGGLWLYFRSRGSILDRSELDEIAKVKYRRQLATAREERTRLEVLAGELEAELRGIAERKRKRLEEIDANRDRNVRDLADDPDALLDRVDAILGESGFPHIGTDETESG